MNINHRIILSHTKDYVYITIALMLFAFAWTFFLLPYEIVTGGVTGISAIIFYTTKFKIENSYLLINIALLVVALKILGVRFLMKTIYAIVALYFLLKFAQMLIPLDEAGNPVKILGEGQDFMSVIIGCSLSGTSLAIVFSNAGSTGGTDIVAAAVNKYYHISLGQVLIVLDIIIIGSCMFIPDFGHIIDRAHKVVFGICAMVVETNVLDYIMNRRRESVQFMIFSEKYQEISDAIATETDHSLTILDGHGWYTGRNMKVICLIARKNESLGIFRLIKLIDPHAFVSQSSVIGVYGEGFDSIKVKVRQKKD